MTKTWMSWSSGKDSAWCLYEMLQNNINVDLIFTTINQKRSRVAMHAVREELLELQAKNLNIPLYKINIPEPCDNDTYQKIMQEFIDYAESQQVTNFAFGDLFLENIKNYRIEQLASTNIKPIFPLWQQDTKQLANKMIANGLKAIITCVDSKQLDPKFLGHEFNAEFINNLPANVDPCGENGEFHTFTYASPMFAATIDVALGAKHQSSEFHFIDLQKKS